MNIFGEFFTPRNKKDALVLLVIFIGVFGFIGTEVYTTITILNNPYGLDIWYSAMKLAGGWYEHLFNTKLMGNILELSGDYIFVVDVYHFSGLNITIEFKPIDCVIERIVIAKGHLLKFGNAIIVFEETEDTLVEVENNTISLHLREMNYSEDFDVLFIRAINMAEWGAELYYKRNLN